MSEGEQARTMALASYPKRTGTPPRAPARVSYFYQIVKILTATRYSFRGEIASAVYAMTVSLGYTLRKRLLLRLFASL